MIFRVDGGQLSRSDTGRLEAKVLATDFMMRQVDKLYELRCDIMDEQGQCVQS